MAAEQALGKKVDGRADVYALGILTHELLTGKRPITGETAMGVLAAHLTVLPPRVSEVNSLLDVRLDAPILRMLEKNPDDRPATAGAAIAELKRAAEQAGHVVPTKGLRLSRPEHVPLSREGASFAPTDRGGSSLGGDLLGSERGLEREVRVRTGDASPARRGVIGPVLALVVVVGAVVTYAVTRTTDQSEARVGGASSAVVPAAGASAPVVDSVLAAAEDSPKPKAFVDLTLQGAPRGARVLLDGKPIGEAPGPVPLPMGDASVQLTVTAPGYETGKVAVIPNQAASAAVLMRKRSPGPASSRAGIPSDLENPF
jgi:serine/threonine-protein kinase